jgi:Tol biopolymer transport system component
MKRKSFLIFFLAIGFVLSLSLKGIAEERIISFDRGAQDPSVSYDSTRIAFSAFGKIWIIPSRGGEAQQITHGLGWDTHPAWSPDGQFLAYSHFLPEGTDLVIHNFATGGSNIIYHTDKELGQIAYHPQGDTIYFLLDSSQYDSHLWRIPVEGGEAEQLTFTENWHEWSFAFSPSGKEVLLDHGRFGGSDLYLMTLADLKATRLTDTPTHEFSVAWGQDVKQYVYIESEDGIDHITVKPADGGTGRRVYSSPYDQKQLASLLDDSTAVLCAGRRLYRLDLTSGTCTHIDFKIQLKRPELSEPNLLIINARLFDGTGSDVILGATIEIRKGRIAAVHKGDQAKKRPSDLPVLDAKGKTVLPGLIDNHYHFWNPHEGIILLKRGVTAVRDPGVQVSMSMNYKEAIASGIIEGPDIYTCGPLIDGRNGYHPKFDVEIADPEKAAILVNSLKDQGMDALKVYFMLNPEVLKAIVNEAKKQGLKVTGHIGVRTSWNQAIDAGIDGLCHIRIWKDFLPPEIQPDGENESLDGTKNPMGRMQFDWTNIDPDSPEVGALIERMAIANVGLDPTLGGVTEMLKHYRKKLSLDQYAKARLGYERMKRFVMRCHERACSFLPEQTI